MLLKFKLKESERDRLLLIFEKREEKWLTWGGSCDEHRLAIHIPFAFANAAGVIEIETDRDEEDDEAGGESNANQADTAHRQGHPVHLTHTHTHHILVK